MESLLLNINSKLSVNLVVNNVYLVTTSYDLDIEKSISKKEVCYINFPFQNSIKVIPFYEKMSEDKEKSVCDSFKDKLGFEIKTDKYLGRLLVVTLCQFELNDIIVIGLAGLTDPSIEKYLELAQSLLELQNSGKIIVFYHNGKLKFGSASVVVV